MARRQVCLESLFRDVALGHLDKEGSAMALATQLLQDGDPVGSELVD